MKYLGIFNWQKFDAERSGSKAIGAGHANAASDHAKHLTIKIGNGKTGGTKSEHQEAASAHRSAGAAQRQQGNQEKANYHNRRAEHHERQVSTTHDMPPPMPVRARR